MPKDPSAINSYASVIVESNVGRALDYEIPSHLLGKVHLGTRVLVPLQNRSVFGMVISLKNRVDFPSIRAIESIASDPLPPPLLSLAKWISSYYCSSLHRIFSSMMPPSVKSNMKAKQEPLFSLQKTKKETADFIASLRRSAPTQGRVLEALLEDSSKGLFLKELKSRLGNCQSALKSLIEKKWISSTLIEVDRSSILSAQDYFPTKAKTLSLEQGRCYEKILPFVEKSLFSVHLIHGVTGSGKTEIYMQLIAQAIEQKKGALFLVPEIALTSQMIEKFRSRFGKNISVLHHRLSGGERRDSWNNLLTGKTQIALGARSALFSPLKNLGLIIIDEEHDSSYKQTEETPCYNARDCAVMLGKLSSCPVILGSATPSLESFVNAKKGKYHLHTLTSRANQSTLPKVEIIDMKREKEKTKGFSLFSSPLLEGIKKRQALGEQTLLFLNQRGYHKTLLCKRCGHVEKCPHCDLSLTYHKKREALLCHLCDFQKRPPQKCPSCSSIDYTQYSGVGTELVEKSLHAIFPSIRTLRMDRDTTQKKHSHEEIFKQFRSGKADVLIGTQMIAKGLHFDGVSLVGILHADASLHIPDFRSPERVFQLITQVAGRAGRGDIPGEVILQTFLADSPVIRQAASLDFSSFYSSQIDERKMFLYPPYTHFIRLIFSGKNEKEVETAATLFQKNLSLPPFAKLFPITACGYAKIRDKFRFQMIISSSQVLPITHLLEKKRNLLPRKIHLLIDVDPLSTFF